MYSIRILLIIVLIQFGFSSLGQDLRSIKNLSGSWKFSVGDDPKWANPDFDDSDWSLIRVPGNWERYGYDNYDGFAWYRKTFELGTINWKHNIYLYLGYIDDVSEVYINGKYFARDGNFPPNFETQHTRERVFPISQKEMPSNKITIAIRVYDMTGSGGIEGGRIGLYYDYDSNFIDIPLAGTWKFKLGKNNKWANYTLDESDWEEIHVPGIWEQQGYPNYDGYAWYRKSIELQKNDIEVGQYLVLGKIDDLDYVYLNGKRLGSYQSIRKDFNYPKDDEIYLNIRYYPIPAGYLKPGRNTIAVQVLDHQGSGGIRSGPIGITSEDNHYKLCRKYDKRKTFMESIFETFFDIELR